MSRRSRFALIAAGSAAGLLAALAIAAIVLLQSQWFFGIVRERIVSTVETATGGRVEAGSFHFDWKRLRAEITGFTVHGTEPDGKPPLFRADSIVVGLKIVSALKREVDVASLEVTAPRVYLIVDRDGHTNVPEPKIKQQAGRSLSETILDLAVGRFDVRNGVFEVESRGSTPFSARGQNLLARFTYEAGGPRYRGNVSVQPLDVQWGGRQPLPVDVSLSLVLGNNRLEVSSARLAAGDSLLEASGNVDDLASLHGAFRYMVRASLADFAHQIDSKLKLAGATEITGEASVNGLSQFAARGRLRGSGVSYQDATVRLRGFRVEGDVAFVPGKAEISGLRLAGTCDLKESAGLDPFPVEGTVANSALHASDLELRGIALGALGGTFQGEARVRAFDRYGVEGSASGFEVRRVVALYSPRPLPWDAQASGPVLLEGSFRRKAEFKASATLAISRVAQSPAVHGNVVANYDQASRTLDLGSSSLSLPSSRVEFSGAIGRELRVRLSTRDLEDFLPALGADASAPVRLQNGSASFEGTVTGRLDAPVINGHLTVSRFAWSGEAFDAFQADVAASPSHLDLRNGSVARGAARAQFQIAAALEAWKLTDGSMIFGNAALSNGGVADALAAAGASFPATGTFAGTLQVSGTVANPLVNAELTVEEGTLRDEPFDRLTARIAGSNSRVEVQSAQVSAGGKRADLWASFESSAPRFAAGRLRFRVVTKGASLDQIRTVAQYRAGLQGVVSLEAEGSADLVRSPAGKEDVRLRELKADLTAQGMRLDGQALGDTHFTAATEGQDVRVRLDSNFARSSARGDGHWRLEGDYPGEATLSFSNLDLAAVADLAAPAGSSAARRIAGVADGELRVSGPALKPELMKSSLRLTKLELAPAPGTASGAARAFTLRNSGPVVVSLTNSTATVESVHLVGNSTDLTLSGRYLPRQAAPLDLRAKGRLDLAIVKDFYPEFLTSGVVTADASVRGALDAPQVSGRMEFQDAAFSIADLPNGISNAKGVLVFSGDRATIQSLTGESGGGKVSMTGFAGYGGGEIVFRLHAEAVEVRVRYPAGVSTVANANLNLTGTASRSMLSGSVTVLRTGFNPESDFSSMLASSAEPARTPATRTGFLAGLNLDVQIQTSPDIQFQSSLTEDVQAEANLRLRGTATNPALLGRVSITQGQLVFFGTKYSISQGLIAFYNPVKIDPILNVDLETKARGIEITLTVSGSLNKLNLTPRSDPPLQFSEIVALLATGQTPNSDPTTLTQQSNTSQSWQQTGASAMLGQAIASPVAGRLQRFFGVSKLRIDPTLPGVTNNPQAQLTLEQQVTPEITFTYITNVTNSNPQVVRVEWAFSRQWSAVALREENGMLGLDFFYKKRFK